MAQFDIIIVGSGHGGANTAIALRQQGFTGSIAMLGDEPELPYERPPLSKDYLLGNRPFEKLLIRPAEFWQSANIEMLPSTRITAVLPDEHQVVDAEGQRHGYGKLVWAAGGSPRGLACPGHDLGGVHTVRTRADIDRIVAGLENARRVAVVGGGYIGLEAAAAIRKRGHEVVVLEAFDRVLARVAGEAISRFYEAEHRAQGCRVELGVSIAALEGADGAVAGVRLGDGRLVPADLVVVGIGIQPNVQPLQALGAASEAGVEVDEACRTALPDVYAVGDCTLQLCDSAPGERIRIESVQNALEQAGIVARDIMGIPPAGPRAAPRFWSDQYDLKLQTLGLSRGHDAAVVRGDPASRSFSVAYLRDGALVALDAVNNPRDFVQARTLVASRARVDPARLADPATPLAGP